MKFIGTLPKVEASAKRIFVSHIGPNGHWDFPDQMGGREYTGFIYVVYDKILCKAYLGKKTYRGNGKLNKGVEGDWKKYVSSSKLLKEMFKERPKEEFEFICIEQYKARGALSYAETWSACYAEVPTTKAWYNTRVEAVSWAVNEGITNRHKERLEAVMKRV